MLINNRRYLGLGIGLAACVLAFVGLTHRSLGNAPTTTPVSRSLEPVILSGEQFLAFNQALIDDLFVYAYDGTGWTPVPYQIDEVDITGTYTVEDGILDDNDELVFMSMDLGSQASASEWLPDPVSRSYPRYELLVTNPLAPGEQGWVYLYRSETLSPAPTADYVDWDQSGNRFVAGAYVMGFNPAAHAGIDSLELNGTGVDVLDRSKIRLNVDCYIGFPINVTLTEDDLAGMMDPTPAVDGSVRAGGGSLEASSWAYYALNRSRLVFDLASMAPPPPCTSIVVKWLRLSTDWRDPTVSGMSPATYFDPNTPDGVPVDGSFDTVPTLPVASWRQVSGGRGSLVNIVDVSLQAGTLSNYYKDDLSQDPGDTGDMQSFADAGARVDAPTGQVMVDMLTYVLEPGQPNLGETFFDFYQQPLQASAITQSYSPPNPALRFFIPVILNH